MLATATKDYRSISGQHSFGGAGILSLGGFLRCEAMC